MNKLIGTAFLAGALALTFTACEKHKEKKAEKELRKEEKKAEKELQKKEKIEEKNLEQKTEDLTPATGN